MEDEVHELEKIDLKDFDENDEANKKKFKMDGLDGMLDQVLKMIPDKWWHFFTGLFGLWVAYALCFDWVIPLVAQMLRGAGNPEDGDDGRRLSENVSPNN